MDGNDKKDGMDNLDDKGYNIDNDERGNPEMSPQLTEERWISTGEAAQLLGVKSLNTVKRWARDGKIRGRKLGVWIQISHKSVEDFLRNNDSELGQIIDQQEKEEARLLEERIDRLEKDPSSSISWDKVRRSRNNNG